VRLVKRVILENKENRDLKVFKEYRESRVKKETLVQ